jgi:hypothetical protein
MKNIFKAKKKKPHKNPTFPLIQNAENDYFVTKQNNLAESKCEKLNTNVRQCEMGVQRKVQTASTMNQEGRWV